MSYALSRKARRMPRSRSASRCPSTLWNDTLRIFIERSTLAVEPTPRLLRFDRELPSPLTAFRDVGLHSFQEATAGTSGQALLEEKETRGGTRPWELWRTLSCGACRRYWLSSFFRPLQQGP